MPVNNQSKLWNFWPRNRVRLSWLAALALLAWLAIERPEPAAWNSVTGIVACMLMIDGVFLRSWSAGIVHKDHKLATAGPYSLCRHPLYVGSFFATCGVTLMLGGVGLMLISAVVFALLYLPTARNEEQVLAEAFDGQWLVYTEQTAMLHPRSFSAVSERISDATWSAAQWRYNREYQMPLMTLAAVAVMQIIRNWSS